MLIVMYFQDVCRRIVIYSAVGLGGIFLLFAMCGSLNLAYHLFAGHPAAVSPLAPPARILPPPPRPVPTAQIASQSPPASTAGTRFDGTYAFVSATKLNENSITMGSSRRCEDTKVVRPPLTIVNGHAASGLLKGTVGARGELWMQRAMPDIEITTGRIDDDGTVRARQKGHYCSYDLIWLKTR
jgi:hypothetical protein